MIDPATRADRERLVDEGLAGLREHPSPLLAERFACMLGVPPSLAGVTAAETAAIVGCSSRTAARRRPRSCSRSTA